MINELSNIKKEEVSPVNTSSWDYEKAYRIFDFLDINENTKRDYKYRIGLFLDFIKENNLNRNSFLEYKNFLRGRIDYTVSTKNKYLAAARVFLKELNRQGVLPTDITQNIKSFSQSKKHKKDGLNSEEINKLSNILKALLESSENARLKAIISLLIFQGLRQVEITRLDIKDIDLIRKTAFIRGKGEEDKELIYLHPETIKHLKDYLKTNMVKDGPLFVSQSNNHKNKRLTTRGLRLIIKKVLNDLEIDKSVHGFRHYFTTTLIKNYKGDLLEVAQYTIYKSLEMLQVYNDNLRQKSDLPRYYRAFRGVSF